MKIRLTRVQWIILIVAWLGWVFDVMDTALFNFAKVPMILEMVGPARYKLVGPQIEGKIQTWFLVGWALGGLIFGILADRWGRTRTLIVTILMYCVLTGATALCQTPDQVMITRFLTALGIGGEWAAGAALIAESLPDDTRGFASSFLQSAAAVGPVLASLANLGLVHMSWRALFLVGIIPALLCVVIRTHVPEPPLAQRVKPLGSPFSMLGELFSDAVLRRNTLVAMVLGIVGVTGAGVIPFWIPNLVIQGSRGLGPAAISARVSAATMVIHIGTLLGVFAFPWIAQRIGRKPAFAIFFAMSPITGLLALMGGAEYHRLLLLLPLTTFFSIGVSAGFVLYFPELFPTHLRATGSSLAYNVGRVVSAPIPWLTGIVIASFGGSVVAGVMIAICIYLFGLLAVPFAPETLGKPLPGDPA